jgi:DNA polymerase-1
MPETLYIIDGHSQIYRAYYAPFRALTSPTGEPTRATYVFCSMMLKFFNERKPRYVALAADSAVEKLKRKTIFPDYKVTRKPSPEDLPPQIARIMTIVEAMEIPILQLEGYEADDIIATGVAKFASADMNVVMISRDKDLDQLLGEHVVMYDPMDNKTIDAASLLATKGYPADKAVEAQTLMGDTSDNVPGIPGIGPKTAADLIGKYGTVDNVLAHADELPPKLKDKLLAGGETLRIARQLVTLDRRVPIDLDLAKMRWPGLKGEKIRPIFEELGFYRLLEQLDKQGVLATPRTPSVSAGSMSPPAPPPPPPAPAGSLFVPSEEQPAKPFAQQPPAAVGTPSVSAGSSSAGLSTAKDFDYRCVDTPAALQELASQLAGVTRLSVDTETTNKSAMRCQLVGISLAWQAGRAVYLPIRGPLGSTLLELDEVRRVLGPILADAGIMKVGQNLKYDIISLAVSGITLAGAMFDTMVAAHVLDSTRPSYKLDALAAEFLQHRGIPIEDLIGRGKKQITMDAVPCHVVTTYACEDADLSLRLADALEPKLQAENLYDLFAKLEMPLLPVLADMEMRGIAVDPAALKRMGSLLSAKADKLHERIVDVAGTIFNPDSPKQLVDVLFGKLHLPVQRKTATGPSTDSDVLETLAADPSQPPGSPGHELPALVLDYRKLQKLLGTYLESLAVCILPRTGRIHTSFHQAGTATGRLSSSDPNLQNIPIRTEEGRQIRSAFVADDGCVLLSADYSQVELRVLAHLCEDPTLMQAFHDDLDIHHIVAAEVFGVPLDQVTHEMRGRAKTVNFGIIYGQTAFGLAASLRIGRKEAGDFIAAYKNRFPQIDAFLASCVQAAREHGYVETIFRRRRRITEIDSRNPARRNLAERLAINSVVQGSAADLIKQAMVNIDTRIRQENRPGKMLLQIHDELLFEVPTAAVEPEREMIVAEMTGAIKLRVPLKVETGTGKNWMEAK